MPEWPKHHDGSKITPEELVRAKAIHDATVCPSCGDPDDDGSVCYGCEGCGRVVCGMCLQESGPFEPPYCLDCEKPDA